MHFWNNTRKWGLGVMAASILLGGSVLGAETGWAATAGTQQNKAAASQVILKSNGVVAQQQGIIRNGKVWVPVSFMRDTLHMPVTYDKTEKVYSIGTGNKLTKLRVSPFGVSITVKNYYISEYEGLNLNNRLYVPFNLLSDYLGYQGDWHAATKRLNVLVRPQNKLSVATESYAKVTDGASIKLDYPQISGLGSKEAETAINNTLKQAIMSFAAGANKDIANKGEQDRPYEYEGNYIVTYNQNGVLSLVTDLYAYTGGAHGTTLRQAYTFSLKDGKRLLLGDLLKANPNYKKVLNAKLAKLITAEGGYLGGFEGLTTEKDFYLKDGSLVIFFQLYEYTAYASGFPTYSFSFRELLPDGSSPVARFK